MRRSKTISAALLSVIAMPYGAWAQTGTGAANAADDTENIVVTGSRIERSTFQTPNPVTVIGADQIAKLGQVNISETLLTLPQNLSKLTDTNTGLSIASANIIVGASIADLRGLNPNNGVRTLTLVNTKRFVPSTTGGGVDANLVPSMLVKSVETVTGGASAAYGTDALAGVVNIILDNRLNGMKVQVDYGQTFRGDGKTKHWSFAGGTDFAQGRGHFVFGAEWQDLGAVGDCVYVREWCAKSPDIFTNEQNATNGLPHYIRGDNGITGGYDLTAVFRATTLAPRVNPAPLRNLVFSDDGRSLRQFDPGLYTSTSGIADRQGGNCRIDCSPWAEVQLRPSIERISLYSHAEYEISPSIKATLEGSYGRRQSDISTISLGVSTGNAIRADNIYLKGVTYTDVATGQTRLLTDLIAAQTPIASSSSQVSQAPGVPTIPLFVAKENRNVPGGRTHVNTDVKTWRIMAGLEGDLEFLHGWKWDAYYQYGRTHQLITESNVKVNKFYSYALDAVDQGLATTGVANGVAVCRATLPGPANTTNAAGFEQLWNQADAAGCVPLNIFGKNTENPAAIAYAYRPATEDFTYNQHVAALNLNGDLFDGWAGAIKAALGGEYRYENGMAVHGKLPFNVVNANAPFGNDFGGSLSILEGYAEGNVPLLKDLPLAESVDLDIAYRHTHQTNKDAISGKSKTLDFDTWKISGTWDVTDWLRFRATRSRDVRAASFLDLYYNTAGTLPGPPGGVAFNPWNLMNGSPINDFTAISSPANFNLSPEIGNTLTAGIVLQPKGFLNGLRISVDYYDIKIRDAIVSLSAQQVVDACNLANIGCERIFNGAGTPFSQLAVADRKDIENIIRGSTNIGSFRQSGYDVEAQYNLSLARISASLPGAISLRAIATINDKMDVNLGNGAGTLSYHGQTGGSAFGGFTAPPKYLLNTFATYSVGGFSITSDAKYIPKGIYDVRRSVDLPTTNANSINNNTVPSRLYIGLSTSYKFALSGERTAEIFMSIRNLFDVDPPASPSNVGGAGAVQGNGGPTNPVYFDTIGAQWRAGFRVNF